MEKKLNIFRTITTIATIFLTIGLIESVIVYLKLGDILFTNKGLVLRFVVTTYFAYWVFAVLLIVLIKIFLLALKKISVFTKYDNVISIISVTFALAISARFFLFSFDNIVQNPFTKKGIGVLFTLFVICVALCFLFQFIISILLINKSASRFFNILGTTRTQMVISGLYILVAVLMVLFVNGHNYKPDLARPNIWLISIDTLRQDRLSCYGYDRNQTPHLDRFASDGVLFENAFSTDHWTLPAHVSIFTSLNPPVHGANHIFDKMSKDLETFPEILSENGYECLGAVDLEPLNYVGAKRNFNQGYQYYSHYPVVMSAEDYIFPIRFIKKIMVPFEREHSSSIISSIIRWMPDKESSSYFFFLHLYDVHSDHNIFSYFWGYPYYPFEPFADHLVTNKELFRDPSMFWKGNAGYLLKINEMASANENYGGPPKEQIQFFSELYDCGVSWVDYQLGRLFDHMRKIGVYDNSIIIVTSDHGESFYEHKRMSHSEHYETCIRIPLIIKPAGNESLTQRTSIPISLIDIGPTLLDLADLPGFHKAEGKSVANIISKRYDQKGDSNDLDRIFFSGSREKYLSLRKGKMKLLRFPVKDDFEKNYRVELYNIEEDIDEKINLSETETIVASEYDELVESQFENFQNLRNVILGDKPTESIKPTGQVIEKLRGLGYLK